MEAGILSKQIEGAQKKVEEQNFVSRKNVLKYDDVMNVQRMIIYEQRRRVLEGHDISEEIRDWIGEMVEQVVLEHTVSDYQEEWDVDALFHDLGALYPIAIERDEIQGLSREELVEEFVDDAQDAYAKKEEDLGSELMREVERFLVLQVVDVRWREHLESMDYLREGIHLRAMAQKDPLSEYRAEGHILFQELRATIREEVLRYLFHLEIEPEQAAGLASERPGSPNGGARGDLVYEHESVAGADAIQAAGGGAGAGTAVLAPPGGGGVPQQEQRVASEWDRVGRNDPCPCGSGKKYKKCHGQ
jgi:preprotein translocase subunit SecA